MDLKVVRSKNDLGYVVHIHARTCVHRNIWLCLVVGQINEKSGTDTVCDMWYVEYVGHIGMYRQDDLNRMDVFVVNPSLIPFLTQSTNIVRSRKVSYYLVCPTEWTVRSGREEGCKIMYFLLYLTCMLIFLDLQWSKVILNYSLLTSGHSQKNSVKKGGKS